MNVRNKTNTTTPLQQQQELNSESPWSQADKRKPESICLQVPNTGVGWMCITRWHIWLSEFARQVLRKLGNTFKRLYF
jgi:hypothetical protein